MMYKGLTFFIINTMSFLASGRRVLVNSVGRHRTAFQPSVPVALGRVVGKGYKPMSMPHQPVGAPLLSSLATSSGSGSSDDEGHDWDTLLPFEKHSHNSVKITVDKEGNKKNDPYSLTNFHSKLEATIATAQQLNKSAIWLTVPIARARLMEEASKAGFEFHHAEGNVATLSKWLLEAEVSRIPTFATHQVGVGAIVINSSNEILCVREARRNYRPWKIPGGLAELGEGLDEAVVREVHEETGISCKFGNVLCVRHSHGAQFGRSDLYFVCQLEPIPDENGKVLEPTPQEGEIEAAAWVPLSEYRNMVQSYDGGHPMMATIMKVLDQSDSIQRTIVPSVVPGRKPSPIYHAAIREE